MEERGLLVKSWLLKRLFLLLALSTRSMTLGVKGVVQDDEGKVFLVRHTYVAGWHLPGGGVERGENVFEAIEKELREEGNIVLTARPELIHVYRNPRTSRFDHVVLFDCRAWKRRGARAPDREIAETGFFPLDGLPDGTTDQTRNRLAEVFQLQPVRDIW